MLALIASLQASSQTRVTRSQEVVVSGRSSLQDYLINRAPQRSIKAVRDGVGIKLSSGVNRFSDYDVPAFSEIKALAVVERDIASWLTVGAGAGNNWIGTRYSALTGEVYAEGRVKAYRGMYLTATGAYSYTQDIPKIGLSVADGFSAAIGVQVCH